LLINLLFVTTVHAIVTLAKVVEINLLKIM